MLVSIIIPIYNVENYIRKCLNSIINQTYKNIEIIIVDDGSIDSSTKICQEYAKLDDRIKLITSENYGVSHARNLGIDNANGEYIAFIDSDDFIDSDFLEELVIKLQEKNVDLSCCDVKSFKDKEITNIEKCEKIINDDDKYLELLKTMRGYLCNKLYKKSIIDKYKIRLNENISMCEDLLFNFQYLNKCNSICYINKKMYHYIENGNSLSKSLKMTWFDCLKVYKYIYDIKDNYNNYIQEYITLQYMYVLCEAKMRIKIMKLALNEIFDKYEIDVDKIFREDYKKIIKSQKISFKEKLKLFIFYRFNDIARKIKFRKGKFNV